MTLALDLGRFLPAWEADVELIAAALRLASRKSRTPRNVRAASEQFERAPGSATEAVLVNVCEWYSYTRHAPQYVEDAFLGIASDRLLEELRRAGNDGTLARQPRPKGTA